MIRPPRHPWRLLPLPALALLACGRGAGDAPEIFAEGGLAIRGTDPVGYFRDGAPRGRRPAAGADVAGGDLAVRQRREPRGLRDEPEAYAPQYGGYCAYALAQGALASTVPEAFTIHDGRLYLNYSLRGAASSGRRTCPGYIRAADANWPGILG